MRYGICAILCALFVAACNQGNSANPANSSQDGASLASLATNESCSSLWAEAYPNQPEIASSQLQLAISAATWPYTSYCTGIKTAAFGPSQTTIAQLCGPYPYNINQSAMSQWMSNCASGSLCSSQSACLSYIQGNLQAPPPKPQPVQAPPKCVQASSAGTSSCPWTPGSSFNCQCFIEGGQGNYTSTFVCGGFSGAACTDQLTQMYNSGILQQITSINSFPSLQSYLDYCGVPVNNDPYAYGPTMSWISGAVSYYWYLDNACQPENPLTGLFESLGQVAQEIGAGLYE